MEQRINKLLIIVGAGIAFESLMFVLYFFLRNQPTVRDEVHFILFSFLATYFFMLFFAKRAGIFDKTSFLKALLYALLISIPIILFPPIIGLFCQLIFSGQVASRKWIPDLNWIPLVQAFSIFYIIKFIVAAIIAFIFCTRLEAIIGLTDEKELQLYGAITQGVIFRKWKHRHLHLVKIEYHIDGSRYETDPKIDRRNSFSENDKVTVLYSTRIPYISVVKEFTD
jgi:hypothetical protein